VEFRHLQRYVGLPRALFEPESRRLEADGRLRLEHQVGDGAVVDDDLPLALVVLDA